MSSIDYLSIEDLIEIGEELIPGFRVRDFGLLTSAIARPQTTVFGDDAYGTFAEKAGALMHSLARNHCLIDGNKRLAWSATRIFCLMNGYDINLNVDEAEELVISVSTGKLDANEIAPKLQLIQAQ